MDEDQDIHTPYLRDTKFVSKPMTRIWQELPSAENPYHPDRCLCHGYDLLELIGNRSLAEVIYLLLRGDLPSQKETQLLEALMIGLINPGPRHPAVRAAISSAVSKTNVAHLLPIGLSILSGPHLGASEVETAMRFLNKHRGIPPLSLLGNLINTCPKPAAGDWHIAPGFGSRFGSRDTWTQQIAEILTAMPGKGMTLKWGQEFAAILSTHQMGWLATGLAAATFLDLGFQFRQGPGLFQLISAPGILAHATEMANKPITALPFISNDRFVTETI